MSRQGIAFDYNSPAELHLSRRRGRHADYRRFATAAEAIHYAVVELRTRQRHAVKYPPQAADRGELPPFHYPSISR